MRESKEVADHNQLRAHVDKIAASGGFANADRLSRFLRFTVEAKIRGEEAQIKEFLLGREVFDRGEDYDPRLDPIVRVEARRLRRRLEEYYAGPGSGDPLRIEFPKGSYAPVIRSAAAAPVRSPASSLWFGLAAAAVILAMAAVWWPRSALTRLDLAVVPARWIWEDTGLLETIDEDLAERVAAALANRSQVTVAAWPIVQRYRGERQQLQALSAALNVREIAVVAARRQTGKTRITVFLLDPESGRKHSVGEFANDDAGASSREALVNRIAVELSAAIR